MQTVSARIDGYAWIRCSLIGYAKVKKAGEKKILFMCIQTEHDWMGRHMINDRVIVKQRQWGWRRGMRMLMVMHARMSSLAEPA